MHDAILAVEIDPCGIAVIRMQDAPRRNALSVQMVEALREALASAGQDERVRAVVLAGLPDYFSTGASEDILLDIVERRLSPADLTLPLWMLDVPVPTIAAMEGHAVGGGLALGVCADIVLMANESRYGCTFMKMGFTPGMGTT